MSTSVKQLRLQILTRSINRREISLTKLKEEIDTNTRMSSSAQSKYNTAYNYLNNLSSTLSDEDKQTYTQQMENAQNLIYALAEKDNDVQLEMNTEQTLLEMEREEKKNLTQSMSKTIKSEAPKTQS